MNRRSFGLVFLLLLIFVYDNLMMQTEAKLCHFKSRTFKGRCYSSRHCTKICEREGHQYGLCKTGWLRSNCNCIDKCGGHGGDYGRGRDRGDYGRGGDRGDYGDSGRFGGGGGGGVGVGGSRN